MIGCRAIYMATISTVPGTSWRRGRSGYGPYGSGYPYNDFRTVPADGAAFTIQPDANSTVITVVNAGAQVKVLDNGPWTHVEANGQDGFMRTGALR